MKKINLYIILSLLVALFIYVFYRSENTVINQLTFILVGTDNFQYLRSLISDNIHLPEWIIYSLPGALWIFSATLIAKNFYFMMFNRLINCSLFPLLFAIGLEIMQLLNITNGTFDVLDLFFSAIAWSIAFFWIKSPVTKINIFREALLRSSPLAISYLIVYLSDVWI